MLKWSQSEVMALNYGVPQGSVLGPYLFSIHFDGVSSSITLSNCTLYADDTELHASNCTAASAEASVNCDLVKIDKWLSSNHMVPNPDKSLVMKIGSIPALKSSEVIDVRLRNQRLKEVTTAKYLGVHVDSALSWNDHLTKQCTKIYPILCFLNRLSFFVT